LGVRCRSFSFFFATRSRFFSGFSFDTWYMNEKITNNIYPVILKVPEEKQALTGRELVRFLSQYAREAVISSAQKSGIDFFVFEKNDDGVPMPSNGFFWSLSHKPEYVAGVISDARIGIDIEPIRPVQSSLVNRILDKDEQQVTGMVSDELFYRCWTGKEVVLKATGVGLKGLSQCKLHQVIDDKTLVISCLQEYWKIEQFYFDNHVASVVREEKKVQWALPVSGK